MASRWHLIEERLLPIESVDQLAEYRRRLLSRYTRPQVAGCLEFLLGKARGEEVEMSPNSKSTYRKMLASLVADHDRPPGNEQGIANVTMLATVAGVVGAAMVAISGHAPLAMAVIADNLGSGKPEEELPEAPYWCWEPPALLAA